MSLSILALIGAQDFRFVFIGKSFDFKVSFAEIYNADVNYKKKKKN